ncbi:MAG: hypothetical protein HYX47_10440 [Burkholderiales bacterium]|nr:hypothetical protein [Burkholderiales bacterium]
MNACDAIGCTAAKSPGKFLCPRHWRLVPFERQRTIYERYRAGRKDFAFLSDPVYLQACVAAIDHIALIERTTGINPYLRHLVLAEKRQGAAK